MGPSLTSEKPVEGALPRKGHVAQLMRGSCRPPGFEKGACSCPREKFSRVVRERGFAGYAHPLGTQEHSWGMSLSSRLPRFPQSACHICPSSGKQPAAFLAQTFHTLTSQLKHPSLSIPFPSKVKNLLPIDLSYLPSNFPYQSPISASPPSPGLK